LIAASLGFLTTTRVLVCHFFPQPLTLACKAMLLSYSLPPPSPKRSVSIPELTEHRIIHYVGAKLFLDTLDKWSREPHLDPLCLHLPSRSRLPPSHLSHCPMSIKDILWAKLSATAISASPPLPSPGKPKRPQLVRRHAYSLPVIVCTSVKSYFDIRTL
jgi:hypothetical protein